MIRAMKLSDIPRVAEIHVFGWRSAYRGIVSDEFLFNEFLVSKRMAKFEQSLKDGAENYVFDDGIIKAFITANPCRDEDKQNSFALEALYVDPYMQRQGIGGTLMAHFEKLSAERGFDDVSLWLFEKNFPARAFYEKLGYAPDGASKTVEPYGWEGMRYSKKLC